MPFVFETSPERSALMQKIKSSGTKPEQMLCKALWKLGYRYRKNCKSLPGKPDILILKHKIAVFIDGEFWHGYKWHEKKAKIKANREYWIPKIERNMARDAVASESLRSSGYKVMRFWEFEVKKDLNGCIGKITGFIETQYQQIRG